MIIWQIEVEDLTHLGGPMGTEYTTSLGVELFSTPEKAIAFMKKRANGRLEDLQSIEGGEYFDCCSIGFRVRKKTVR